MHSREARGLYIRQGAAAKHEGRDVSAQPAAAPAARHHHHHPVLPRQASTLLSRVLPMSCQEMS